MGAIHGHYLRFVSPFVFTFFFSTDLVIFNMVGGLGSFWGPLAGYFAPRQKVPLALAPGRGSMRTV